MASDSLAIGLVNRVITTCGSVIDAAYGVIMGSWPGMTIVTLYVVVVGYMVLTGRAGEKTKEWALSALLLSVLGGIAADQGSYSEWLAGPIYDMAFKLSSVGAQMGDGDGLAATFDLMESNLKRTLDAVDNIEVTGNFITNAWMHLKVAAVTLVLGLLSVGMYLATTALMCIAFFSLFMMLLVGGPCLWLASFKESRHVFWAWLRTTLNYTLWIFYLGIVASVGVTFVSLAVDDLTGWNLQRDGVFTEQIGGAMLLTALSIYMLMKASEWAAAITGGTASQTGVIGAAMGAGAFGASSLLGKAAGGIAAAGPLAAKNAGRVAGLGIRAYSALRGIGK